MYAITKMLDGSWNCQCRIQDGTEYWSEPTREQAVFSLISAARSLNGSYIREDGIRFNEEQVPPVQTCSQESIDLLNQIKSGAKRVLEFNHYLLRYRITQEEADLIIQIREGKKRVV